MTGNTIFITYALIPTGQTVGEGYQQPIHCNYMKKISAAEPSYITEINMNFPNIADFKFLSNGYDMNRIYAITQIVSNSSFATLDDVKPDSTAWKYLDVTNQISSYSGTLTAANLIAQVFKVSYYDYFSGTTFVDYNLDYLNYPSDTNDLCFGDVTYFFGNLTTDIKANVFTTDINIILPLNEFNSTTNASWDGTEKVNITEVGIYDSNKNLVAIGKLNNPLPKDSSIARSIVFALDF